MNIVLFGDSFLGRFGKNLIDQLESTIPKSIVYNCAAGGWNSTDLKNRAQLIAKLNPDYVVLSYGGNDVAPWKKVVAQNEFQANTELILKAFSNSKIIILLCPNVNLESTEHTLEYNNALRSYYRGIEESLNNFDAHCIDTNLILADMGDCHEDDGVHINGQAYDRIILKLGELIN